MLAILKTLGSPFKCYFGGYFGEEMVYANFEICVFAQLQRSLKCVWGRDNRMVDGSGDSLAGPKYKKVKPIEVAMVFASFIGHTFDAG